MRERRFVRAGEIGRGGSPAYAKLRRGRPEPPADN